MAKKQEKEYYKSIFPKKSKETVYVNDENALALNQFKSNFNRSFVDFASNPSSNLEEILNRQNLFKKVFEWARNPEKRDVIFSLNTRGFGDPFSWNSLIYGEKGNFWQEYQKFFDFLKKKKDFHHNYLI